MDDRYLSLFRHILFPLFLLSFLGLNQSSSTGSSLASSSIEESSGSNSAAHMGSGNGGLKEHLEVMQRNTHLLNSFRIKFLRLQIICIG